MEETGELHYMTEGGSGTLAYRERALEALKAVKQMEAGRKYIPVWIDFQTTRLIDLEKIKSRGLQIIKVKIPGNRIVWIEKQNAIDRGYINE